jgi:Mg2+ and Co2+ transporter CorA
MDEALKPPSGPPRVSLFEDLAYWAKQQHKLPTDDTRISSDHTVLLAKPVLLLICAEWMIMREYIKTRLGQVEWELGYPDQFRKNPQVIDRSLKRLHTWRRLLPLYTEMVTDTLRSIEFMTYNARTASSTTTDTTSEFEDIINDLTNTLSDLKELQTRSDRLTSVVVADISIQDSRHGIAESKNVARLAWLATVFIPLTFVSGLFSMQADITTLSSTFGWYFAAALPAVSITLAIVQCLRFLESWRKM